MEFLDFRPLSRRAASRCPRRGNPVCHLFWTFSSFFCEVIVFYIWHVFRFIYFGTFFVWKLTSITHPMFNVKTLFKIILTYCNLFITIIIMILIYWNHLTEVNFTRGIKVNVFIRKRLRNKTESKSWSRFGFSGHPK